MAQLVPLAATALQLAFWPIVKPLYWLFFYPAVFLSSWLGGLVGGIVATVLSILLVIYFFIPPEFSFVIANHRDLISAGVFLCMGILFSVFHDRLQRASQRRDVALAAADTARKELETRVVARTRELSESNELLLKNEERLRLLIAGVEDYAIYTKDLQGIVTTWNPGAQRMYGYTADEIVGHPAPRLGVAGSESEFANILRKAISGETIRQYMTRRQTKSGKILEVSLSIAPLKDRAGTLVGFSTIARDITEQRRAETALRKNEGRYRKLFESNISGVYISTQAGQLLDCNDAMVKMFGYPSKTELLRISTEQLYEHRAERANLLQLLREKGTAYNYEARHVRADGSVIWCLENSSLIEDPEGGPELLLGTIYDISDRKLAEEERRKAEVRFYKAFHASPIGICISTLEDGRFVEVNEAYARMLECEPGELIGRSSIESGINVTPESRERLVGRLRTGEPVRDFKFELRSKLGKPRSLRVAAEPLEVDGIPCMLTLARDTTGEELLERQLRQAQRMEAVGSLAAGVAHDFNNLLGVILGSLDLLRERIPPDDSSGKHMERTRMAVNSATALTRQLLAFSRKQILQPVVLDLNQAVEELNNMVQRLIGADINVVLELEPKIGPVLADSGQMEQVLMNLVVNARDAMPRGGKLTIRTETVQLDREFVRNHFGAVTGKFTKLSVIDTGLGMTKQVLAHIFEPFFTTKEVGKGTGLGLATVYGIVKQSEGYIWVESEPDKGTSFEVYLPVSQSAPAAEPLRIAARHTGGSETILLVEDEEALREVTRQQLEKLGYRVLEAGLAEEAITLFDKHEKEIALLLTDVVMPGMNGRLLGDNLSARKPDLRVLYMSGYTEDEILRRDASDPRQAIMTKPFSREILAMRVREVLNGAVAPERK